MIEVPSYVAIIVMMVVCYYCLKLLDSRFGHFFKPVIEASSEIELEKLREELRSQQKFFVSQLKSQAEDFEKRLADQREVFERRIKTLEQHNDYLMQRLVARERTEANRHYVDDNKAIFISLEPNFYQRDRTALFRSGLKFTALRTENKNAISRELRHARETGRPFRLALISAHGNDEGILCGGEVVPGEWWSQNLFGIEVALFAACESFGILNDLVGIVDYSIGMMDSIETELAEDFIYIFWREYQTVHNPIEAFGNAKEILPELSDRVTIRFRE